MSKLARKSEGDRDRGGGRAGEELGKGDSRQAIYWPRLTDARGEANNQRQERELQQQQVQQL